PDRIVVGECRGGEALDMLQAMNTGHDGSLTTVHANTPRDETDASTYSEREAYWNQQKRESLYSATGTFSQVWHTSP
ncbi:MAG: Flp pilus assembly complex ATPase component TadA, partial [Treponema sp.]|nr:Flp pilus assembly complex ATPase component TadA [Treponema sp.]